MLNLYVCWALHHALQIHRMFPANEPKGKDKIFTPHLAYDTSSRRRVNQPPSAQALGVVSPTLTYLESCWTVQASPQDGPVSYRGTRMKRSNKNRPSQHKHLHP